jgi:cell division protein ZapB
MENTPSAALIAAKVEQLLQKHADLQRSHTALLAQVAQLGAERDLLRSKHAAARSRIDALLDRLHPTPPTPAPGSPESAHETD